MSEERFNHWFNIIGVRGGFLINLLTFIRLGFQQSHDEGGGFVQFNVGFYKFSISVQFGVDN